jgi:tRNA-specific 2-thiouridylase
MGLKMKTDKINWINSDFQKLNLKVLARFRYRQKLFKATLIKKTKNSYLIFEKPQTAISAGQFAVWYIGNELIGSGLIE